MLTMFIRAIFFYGFLLLLLRLMGKRQIRQLQPFELVFTIIVANLATTPMADVGIPLLYGVMPIGALMLCYGVFSLLSLKCEKAREIINGRPTVLVHNGVIDQSEMRRQGFPLPALLEQIRENGIQNLSEVGCAILEISGNVNVFPNSSTRNLIPKDLEIHPGYENIPMHFVLDGELQKDSLEFVHLSRTWLEQQLSRFQTTVENTYFCSVDTNGMMWVQKKGEEKARHVQVLTDSQARWYE